MAQGLEERHVVRNGVAVGQHPRWIGEREMDEARHVIPAAEIEPEDVVAQMEEKLLHLEGERMRLDQRHAFDGPVGPVLEALDRMKRFRPPQRLIRRLRLGNVDTRRMLEVLEMK